MASITDCNETNNPAIVLRHIDLAGGCASTDKIVMDNTKRMQTIMMGK
jgi:hypothetical protein